jgi:hypothetical protein
LQTRELLGFIGVGVLILFVGGSFFVMSAGSALRIAFLLFFIILNCWGGLRQSLALSKVANAPRREGFACPACKSVPPVGNFWHCGKCRQPFDLFGTLGFCPHCTTQYTNTTCTECGKLSPIAAWDLSHQPSSHEAPPLQIPPTLPPQA